MSPTLALRGRMKPTAAWSPANLGSVVVGWWRASDLALTDGTAVASWADKSTQGNTLTQATGAKQPTYHDGASAQAIGGQPVVTFAAANSTCLSKTSPTGIPSRAPMAVYAVMRHTAQPSFDELMEYGATGPVGYSCGFTAGVSHITRYTIQDSSGSYNYSTSETFLNAWEMVGTTWGITFRKNLRSGPSTTTASGDLAGAPNQLSMGGKVVSNAQYLSGDVAEVIYCTRPLTSTERLSLSRYVLARYGLMTGNNYNAAAALTTPSYDGSNTMVENSIIDFGVSGWQGHRYWGGVVPYPSQNANFENPSILVSDNKTTWSVPAGVTNPIIPARTSDGTNADPCLFDNQARDGYVYLLYTVWNSASSDGIWMTRSNDGFATHAAPVKLVSSGVTGTGSQVNEPQLFWDGSQYVILTINSNSLGTSTSLQRRTCATITGTWSAATTLTLPLPGGRKPWHWGKFYLYGSRYVLAVSDLGDGSGSGATLRALWLISTADLQTFSTSQRPLLFPSMSGWDFNTLYRASVTLDDTGNNLDVWYTGYDGSANGWRMSYTSVPVSEIP